MRLFILTFILFISACASTPQKDQSVFFAIKETDVVLPAPPENFTRTGTHTYPQAQLGYAINYTPTQGADAKLDIYIYPLTLPVGLSLADAQETYFMAALNEISTLNPSAKVKLLEILKSAAPIEPGVLKASLELEAEGRKKSFLYLAVVDDVLIKARFTEKPFGGLEKSVDTFVLSLAKNTQFKTSRKRVTNTTVLVGGDFQQEQPSVLLGYALGYAQIMDEALAHGQYLNTFEREHNAMTNGLTMAAVMAEKANNDPKENLSKYPAAQIPPMIDVFKAGFLREYIWQFYRRPYWQQPVNLKLEAFTLWQAKNLTNHKVRAQPPAIIGWETGESKNKTEAKSTKKPEAI